MANKHILVIDDEDAIRQVLKQMLTVEGFRVITAENGQEGLEKLEMMRRPRVILLDLMMPVLDGWGFLRRVRADQRFQAIPVIVTSASGEPRPPGATTMLPKPFGVSKLLNVIRTSFPTPRFFRR